jgi:hypothetical protein
MPFAPTAAAGVSAAVGSGLKEGAAVLPPVSVQTVERTAFTQADLPALRLTIALQLEAGRIP